MLYTLSDSFCLENMGKETDKIIDLLQHWQEYTANHDANLKEFGQWLGSRDDMDKKEKIETSDQKPFRDQYINENVSIEDQIVLHWGRLQRFTHLWSKKALKKLPIHSMEEFGLIKTVELLGSARKSDLVRFTLMETTTCLEMIKRLVRSGYMREEIDPEDRRSRKVSLSPEGKALSRESDKEVRKLSRLLIGNINQQQKQALVEVLKDLDNFHGNMYQQKAGAELEEMLEWQKGEA